MESVCFSHTIVGFFVFFWFALFCLILANSGRMSPPAMWETWVQSLSWKDPLEEGMATHSSILAGRIPGAGGAIGSETTEAT